ncbi:MAG: YtxH domain-containing protein [Terriglobia bacterium]
MAGKSASSCAVFFFAGMSMGALVAILLAPQSGEDTRKLINDKVEQGKTYVNEQREAFRRRTEDLKAEGQRRAEDLKGRANDLADRAGFSRPFET